MSVNTVCTLLTVRWSTAQSTGNSSSVYATDVPIYPSHVILKIDMFCVHLVDRKQTRRILPPTVLECVYTQQHY